MPTHEVLRSYVDQMGVERGLEETVDTVRNLSRVMISSRLELDSADTIRATEVLQSHLPVDSDSAGLLAEGVFELRYTLRKLELPEHILPQLAQALYEQHPHRPVVSSC